MAADIKLDKSEGSFGQQMKFSQRPGPLRIPQAKATGKLDPDWIPDGEVDAGTLDGLEAAAFLLRNGTLPMTGALTLSGDETDPDQAASRAYVESLLPSGGAEDNSLNIVQASINPGPVGTWTTTSSTYADFNGASPLDVEITKRSSTSMLHVDAALTIFQNTATSTVSLAVQLGGVDYLVKTFRIGNNFHDDGAGWCEIAGIPSGTMTLRLRIKTSAGELIFSDVHSAHLKVTEDYIALVPGADGATGPQGEPGSGISDGDKGDVTVSASGATWTIDADAVTYAKMQPVSATDKVLGRSTAGAGDVEEIPCTAAGRALIDDATASDQRTTLGLGTAATHADGDYLSSTNNDTYGPFGTLTIDSGATLEVAGQLEVPGILFMPTGALTLPAWASSITGGGTGTGLDADLVRGTTPSTFGLSLLDDAAASNGRATLGSTAVGDAVFIAANAAAARTAIGAVIGTDVQAFHARLADLAGITYAQGDVLYFNGTNLVALAAGTSGFFLKTLGAGANPAWASSVIGTLNIASTQAYPASSFTTASTTYTDLLNGSGGATITVSLTKQSGSSAIHVYAAMSESHTAANADVVLGVNDGTTDYDVARFRAIANNPMAHSGWRAITGLAAGSYTFKLRVKTSAGTVGFQANHSASLMAMEL